MQKQDKSQWPVAKMLMIFDLAGYEEALSDGVGIFVEIYQTDHFTYPAFHLANNHVSLLTIADM